MKKYKYEKFQIKPGRKVYVLSQHDGDDWSGPVIEHFAKEHATKIGIYTPDKKYLFEVSILNEEGTEYTVKLCRDGIPNGAMMVMMKETLYFGKYYQRDGFNGIVYRFKEGEPVWLQEYKHGVLSDECLTDTVIKEAVGMPLPFDCFFESEEIVERKNKNENGPFNEFIAGDPSGHSLVLAASIDKNGTIRIGQYKNNTFNGLALEVADDHYVFTRFEDGKPTRDFTLTIVPAFGGFSLVLPCDDGNATNLVYCEEGHKMKMMIQQLANRARSNNPKEIVLPDFIDPEAPKPHQQGVANKPVKKKGGKGKSAEERLAEMIGLESVKSELAKMKAMLLKKPDKSLGLNMVFMGNPGTGKTEVARLLAQILYDDGILQSNKVVETDRSGLVAEYIGQTAIKTHAVVNSAMGGVLFIDEAYSLMPTDDKDFGREAIDALIADMENYRGKMCFILAGYEKPMMHMIDTNKGFKSRIQRYIRFDNYSQGELRQIAELRLHLDNYQAEDGVIEAVAKIAYSRAFSDDFANAREVRNILEKLYEIQAIRTSDIKDDFTITMADVAEYQKKGAPAKKDDLTAEERLKKLIGLDGVKKQILMLKAVLAKSKGDLGKTNLNMCFYGNPGTGKTEVARLLADILYDEGILPERKFTEIDASGLVTPYSGESAAKTHQVVKDAIGGVLFIDEAYALANMHSSGKEAIDALIADMENYRGKICIVFAGYEEPMENMMGLNPGFKSRINRNIVFPDYGLEELMQITSMMLKSKNYTMADDAVSELARVIDLLRANPDFGNARGVRNILESVYEIQALRTYNEKILDSNLIKLADIREYEKDHGITFAPKPKKHDFHLSYAEFESESSSYDEGSYTFNSDFIQQVSVNIKVEQQGKVIGEGSGFIISPKGIIATCAHVAGKAESMTVIVNIKTAAGKFISKDYKAETIAFDEDSDVALIGILSNEADFPFYPLAKPDQPFPELLTEIAMGGYPFGGSRFEQITITEGKIQSVNKDARSGMDRVNLYVDLSGHPGSSGSGVIDKKTGRCIGVFAGAAVGGTSGVKLTINYAVPVAYLWSLIKEACDGSAAEDGGYESLQLFTEAPIGSMEGNQPRFQNIEEDDVQPIESTPRRPNIHIVRGDISTFDGDAVVNAANSHLLEGAGVCGAIFRKAGPRKLAAECAKVAPCPVGSAVATSGCDMPVKYIIHAVGPRYDTDKNPERLLSNVYESIFDVARKNGVKSIALPSISTGIYGFPRELAAPIAMREIMRASSEMGDIYVYCFDDRTYEIYQQLLERLG